jgi:RNA recognition motif-containing protein
VNIYVGNLPYSTTDDELKTTFAPFGQVDDARVVIDRDTGRSRGFGFVDMPDRDEAGAAIAEFRWWWWWWWQGGPLVKHALN